MKLLIIIIAIFLISGTLKNMKRYGYGVEDAFFRYIFDIDEETIWIENFSEEKFDKIKIGMTNKQVLNLMGKPLYDFEEQCADFCFWEYADQARNNGDFDQRWVVFDKSYKVIEIRKTFYID